MNKKLLEMFEDHIDFPEDNTTVCWYINYDCNVCYNTDNNVEDLLDGNGETYSGLIKGGPVQIDDYIMYTLDSECGFDYQAIFSLSLLVKEEE